MTLVIRVATEGDIPALRLLIPLSARELSGGHYSQQQVEQALGHVFGVDSQLIADGTYFIADGGRQQTASLGWWRARSGG